MGAVVKPAGRRSAILAVFVASMVALISLGASLGLLEPIFGLIRRIPGGDVVAHFTLIGVMTFSIVYAFVPRSRRPGWAWFRVVGVVLLLVTIDELAQIWLPRRVFSWDDLTANYAGVGVFSIVAWVVIKVTGRRL